MARRKITDSEAMDASDLPDLTAQQMAFVKGLLDGNTAADAYRAAYDCSSMGKNSIWVEASRARSHPSIALWLGAARKACLGTAAMTLDSHLAELERLREIALDTGNVGAAVQAEQLRGKVKGYHVERVQDVTTHDPMATLKEIAQLQPALAEQLALQAGIPWGAEGATKH